MREKNEYGQIRPGRTNVGSIEDMLPGRRGSPGGTAADSRLFLEAVLWRAGTGSPRRDLPEEFGNWNSVSERFRRWARKGVFDSIFKVLSENFDLEYVSVDGTVVQAHAKASGGIGEPPAVQTFAHELLAKILQNRELESAYRPIYPNSSICSMSCN